DNDDKHHYKNGSDSSGKDWNEPIKGKDTSSLANNKGDMLPHTASTMPLFILIGILLTATGGLIFVIQKRLSKKKAIQNPNQVTETETLKRHIICYDSVSFY